MKKEFDSCPAVIDESSLYGFSWMEHVLAMPSPLVVVTTYKANGLPPDERFLCFDRPLDTPGQIDGASTLQCLSSMLRSGRSLLHDFTVNIHLAVDVCFLCFYRGLGGHGPLQLASLSIHFGGGITNSIPRFDLPPLRGRGG